jgi:hypothetical protein
VKQPWSATGFTVSSSLSIFAWALPSGVAVFPCPSSSSGPSFSSTFGPLSCGVLGRLHREFMEIGISIGGNRSRCARVRRSVRIVSRSESRGVGRDAIPLCDNRPCQTLNGIASMRSRRTRGHAMGKKMKNNNQKNRYDVLDDYAVFHPPPPVLDSPFPRNQKASPDVRSACQSQVSDWGPQQWCATPPRRLLLHTTAPSNAENSIHWGQMWQKSKEKRKKNSN